jgi:hypothetical protein
VASMYNALIEHDVFVDNNSKIWKMKIPIITKVYTWYLRRGVILTKDNLANAIGREVKKHVFFHHDETISIYSSSVNLLDLYGQPSR